jgi:hypothetical protein
MAGETEVSSHLPAVAIVNNETTKTGATTTGSYQMAVIQVPGILNARKYSFIAQDCGSNAELPEA